MPESHPISQVTQDREGQDLGHNCGYINKNERAEKGTHIYPKTYVCEYAQSKHTVDKQRVKLSGEKKSKDYCKELGVSAGLTVRGSEG